MYIIFKFYFTNLIDLIKYSELNMIKYLKVPVKPFPFNAIDFVIYDDEIACESLPVLKHKKIYIFL